MRLHTSACAAHSAGGSLGVLVWSPALSRVWMSACCRILPRSTPAGLGRARWPGGSAEAGGGTAGCCAVLEPGVCQPSPEPRVLAVAAGTSIVSAPPRAGKAVRRRLQRADPEHSSNPTAPGVAGSPMTSLASQLSTVIQMWQRAAESLLLLWLNWCVIQGHSTAVDILGLFGACRMTLDPLLIPAWAFLNLFSEPWCL